jgi:hypothetical protein
VDENDDVAALHHRFFQVVEHGQRAELRAGLHGVGPCRIDRLPISLDPRTLDERFQRLGKSITVSSAHALDPRSEMLP